MMRAKVFCVLKKFLPELKGREGVRVLRNRNGGMEVECRLIEIRKDSMRTVYAVEPRYPVTGKHYFELQLVERGEKNIGEIVTNFSGKKLIPRWRSKNTVGFRTSKGQLISVIGYAVRGMAEIVVHAFQIEGRTVYLTEEVLGLYKARYDYTDGTWAISLPKELEQLAEAVAAAMEKAECHCFKKGCKYHYALSEEEAQKVLAERRARQKAAAEAARVADQPSEPAPADEEEIAGEESVVSEPVAAEVPTVVPEIIGAPTTPVEAVRPPKHNKKSGKPKLKERRMTEKKAIEQSMAEAEE